MSLGQDDAVKPLQPHVAQKTHLGLVEQFAPKNGWLPSHSLGYGFARLVGHKVDEAEPTLAADEGVVDVVG